MINLKSVDKLRFRSTNMINLNKGVDKLRFRSTNMINLQGVDKAEIS